MLLSEFEEHLHSPAGVEAFTLFAGHPCVVVDVDGAGGRPPFAARCPVIGIQPDGGEPPAAVDVAVTTAEEAARVAEAVAASPVAAMTLVGLTRMEERLGIRDRLVAESLAYSALQHGAEFRRWLATRSPKKAEPETEPTPPVLVSRDDDVLSLVLNRPQKRNAYSGAMRDALCEALALAVADGSIRRVVLSGAGPCFSAGGDLDEFGEATDAGLAHAARTTRSAAVLIDELRKRVEVRLHGACVGAGIELPAFAGRLVAAPDAFFILPEVRFGLIPGAGGTASILERVGRRRLNYMALTGDRIDAPTALAWGLIDAIEAA